MRFVRVGDFGPPQLAAVAEVAGAVLIWEVSELELDPVAVVTDPSAADWLWRVVGEDGHRAVLAGAAEADAAGGALGELRRLAFGHWLRRWWPASGRDAIPALDAALLDAELAVVTARCEAFFGERTVDSDAAELLAPHSAALLRARSLRDPRVDALIDAALVVVDDAGLGEIDPTWDEVVSAVPVTGDERYAAVAGGRVSRRGPDLVAAGTATVHWDAVPPGVFDAAEDTVDWAVLVGPGEAPTIQIAVATLDRSDASGIPVRADGAVGAVAEGALRADGFAALPLRTADGVLDEDTALTVDWAGLSVTVGVPTAEGRDVRDTVRRLARTRLEAPPAGAFLAEILAAEADF